MSSRAETPAASAAKGGFDYDALPAGYYDQVFHRRRGVQSKWHHLKFAQLRREILLLCLHRFSFPLDPSRRAN